MWSIKYHFSIRDLKNYKLPIIKPQEQARYKYFIQTLNIVFLFNFQMLSKKPSVYWFLIRIMWINIIKKKWLSRLGMKIILQPKWLLWKKTNSNLVIVYIYILHQLVIIFPFEVIFITHMIIFMTLIASQNYCNSGYPINAIVMFISNYINFYKLK